MPSSVILGMTYEPEMRELVIVYRGGRGTYRYFDVPMEEWAAFRASGSKGTYLNEVFKGKNYRYERVAAGEKARGEGGETQIPRGDDNKKSENKGDDSAQDETFLVWGFHRSGGETDQAVSSSLRRSVSR